MNTYIIIFIVVIIAIALYFFFSKKKKPSHNPDGSITDENFKKLVEMSKNYQPQWTFPSRPDPTEKGKISIFKLSCEEVNKQVMNDIQQYSDKTPIVTKSLIKDNELILQLTVFGDRSIVSLNNELNDIQTFELTPDELEQVKGLVADMEENPIQCTPDVGESYPMTFVTLHSNNNSKNPKTYYADGSCLVSSLKSYQKLNEILGKKLS